MGPLCRIKMVDDVTGKEVVGRSFPAIFKKKEAIL